MPKILAFAGSTRTDSLNRKLAAMAAEMAGATLLELRDYPLPIYDGDLEAAEGLPENVLKLKAQFDAHDGLLIACPEYNGSITPLLKNTIDWVSRAAPDEKPLQQFRGKVAGLLAASPGALGGMRGLVHVRAILGGIGVHVIPDQAAVSKAHEGLDDRTKSRVEGVVQALVNTTEQLSG
ncbi:MAG: NAD(P)H-dependent oxidoreductase [Planctomycetota bacterium]